MKQEQFLAVVSRDEAARRFREAVDWSPLAAERVPLGEALGRVLASEVRAPADVPGFARSDMDGYALRARDTYGASEEEPKVLRLNDEVIGAGVPPRITVEPRTATPVATGAIVPRGADAVVMVEDTDADEADLLVRRPLAPGANVAHPGSDIARDETVLRAGDALSSRETGVLAALGLAGVDVVRRPRVVLFSTGDEILAPGDDPKDGFVYDSNGRILADAIREAGGVALERGLVRDDEAALRAKLDAALEEADLVLFSGGTSKGAGDLSYRILKERGEMLVHGVALKPGKPIVLARVGEIPVVILPGFPTSAVFTFHEFVAPWIRARGGRPAQTERSVTARLARAVVSERGRTEFDLVHLIEGRQGLVAYPLGKGSGSVTTYSRADGFYRIPAAAERRETGEEVEVTLIGPLQRPDLLVIGSHCTGLDFLLTLLRQEGFVSKVVTAGSSAGLEAARRGECDIAGIHLLDLETREYNAPFLDESIELLPGYGRRQGVVSRDGSRNGRMINRNRNSGTRVLIDELLGERIPEGYEMEVRSHQAVAAAVRSGRADWGVCIENVADGLHFRFLADEKFDFAIPKERSDRPAVRAFREILARKSTREALQERGFQA